MVGVWGRAPLLFAPLLRIWPMNVSGPSPLSLPLFLPPIPCFHNKSTQSGAYTSICSSKHVPRYNERADELKQQVGLICWQGGL